jgi:alpha-mannosidase
MYHEIRRTSQKIANRIDLVLSKVYCNRRDLPAFQYLKLNGSLEDPLKRVRQKAGWKRLQPNSYWGEPRTDFLLRTKFSVPQKWKQNVALFLPLGEAGDFSHPEALVYIDGEPYAACDRHHREILLAPRWCDGTDHQLLLHGWTGGIDNDPSTRLLMRACALVEVDQCTRNLVALARVALGIADNLDETVPARAYLYQALDEAFKVLDTRGPLEDLFYASIPAALERLREGIARSGAPLDVDITAVGHAHIDVAWLWTLGQTRRKAGRTFYNVLRLMDQFPELCFLQSQAQLYEFVRRDYPALFESIKEKVTEGRWEPAGGMWVEADCNLSGPESLVRQLLLGRSFFRKYFIKETESPVLWLPDTFGFTWNLPQLAREAGLKYFFTIKLGWSQYNRLPYDSFWWQGLDGTRVLTHFGTTQERGSSFASTYNAKASPYGVLRTWTNFQQKDWGTIGMVPPLLMAFGYGDGGGGPTREMLENIREMRDFPAAPRVHCGSAVDFFKKLEKEMGNRLPTWNGELYLEYHRGTYTSQAHNKRANRKSEFLLHDTELLAAMAATLNAEYTYPHEELRRAWELVCLNQFHDILPGTSIGAVYEESQQQYAEVRETAERIRNQALEIIADGLGGDLLVINPTSFPCCNPAFLPAAGLDPTSLRRSDGSVPMAQAVEGGHLIDLGKLPPYSVTSLTLNELSQTQANQRSAKALLASPEALENNLLRVEFNSAGDIIRIYDKVNQCEVMPAGTVANQLQAFEDRPITPDAWEIDISYDDRIWLAEPADSVKVIEDGPLKATLEIRRTILKSEVIQRISLIHNSPRLDFDTTVLWRERNILLKAAFPVDVLSPMATYEIQWGNIQRPTHRNTSWDWARFETCAQKWVDLSEGGYGVSLINDCKYGHDIHNNIMRISLLRSSVYPDPEADLGEHQFIYSLLPHAGGWQAETVPEAYGLNDPLLVFLPNESKPIKHCMGSIVSMDAPNLVIETVKQAEDGEGLIVRLYESQRKRGTGTMRSSLQIHSAWRVNILEEDGRKLEVVNGHVRFPYKPYEIITLRLDVRGSRLKD